MEAEIDNEKYKKIGGWLILLGIGMVATVFLFFITIGTEIRDIIQAKDIDYIFAIVNTVGLIIAWTLVFISCISFFKMEKKFIRQFMNFLFFYIVFQIIMVCYLGFSGYFKSTDSEVLKSVWTYVGALIRNIIVAAIWIPYLLISIRAKSTFRF